MQKSTSQPAAEQKAFPFDRLPPELKVQIVRRAMPQNGLLLRPLPTIAHHEGRDHANGGLNLTDELIKAYHEELQARDWSSYGLPTTLVRVNKFFATEARSYFLNNVPLVFTLNTAGVHFLATVMRRFISFRSHLEFQHEYYIQRMRTFQLTIETDPWAYKAKGGDVEVKHGTTPAKADMDEFKERLRLISDMLMFNSDIRRIIIQIPCLCNCMRVDTAANGESDIIGMLAPIKRLRVQKPVIFRTTHDNKQCVDRHCDKDADQHLIATLESRFSRLTGEALSDKEAAWKRIKTLERPRTTGGNSSVEHGLMKVWYDLEYRPHKFWERAQAEEEWIGQLVQVEAAVRVQRTPNRTWEQHAPTGPRQGFMHGRPPGH
ncbi:MAG: hypothetical protein Q9220_003184 [cf. Caloplaca sp. 1 TL-2023]